MGQLKAEHTVVGAQDEQAQLLGQAEGDPLVENRRSATGC
jgi:DNA-binding GntR family transcriptional regulator